MAVKTNFSSDEWKTALEASVLAGVAITAADPSGIFGTLKEGWANARKLATAKTSASDELSKSVAEDLFTSEGRTGAHDRMAALLKGAKREEAKDRALAELMRAVALVILAAHSLRYVFRQLALQRRSNDVCEWWTRDGLTVGTATWKLVTGDGRKMADNIMRTRTRGSPSWLGGP